MHLAAVSLQLAGTPVTPRALEKSALVDLLQGALAAPSQQQLSISHSVAEVCVSVGVRSKRAAAEPRERLARLLRQGLRCGKL